MRISPWFIIEQKKNTYSSFQICDREHLVEKKNLKHLLETEIKVPVKKRSLICGGAGKTPTVARRLVKIQL